MAADQTAALNDASAAFSHDQDPTQRVEAMTTPEGEKGWETVQSRRTDTARGHGVDVAPDSQPKGVRAETRRENDGDRGEPSNAPTAALEDRCPNCGGDAGNNWFDRSLCPEPCGSMHTRCSNCGAALEGCQFDRRDISEVSARDHGDTSDAAFSPADSERSHDLA